MALPSLLVCVALFGGSFLQPSHPPVSPDPGDLRWVRGVVTAVSANSMTVAFREKSLTLPLDRASQIGPDRLLAVGALVEAHYVDRKGMFRAVLVVESSTAAEMSKRPGRSYRGLVNRTKRGTLSIRVEGKTRSVDLTRRTTLSDAEGRPLATGSKEIASLLAEGEDVLVTYDEQSSDIMAGDILIPGTSRQALEIRKIGATSSTSSRTT